MTNFRFKKLIDRKQKEADKSNRLIYLEIKKGNYINAYDLIKEEYMKGKHSTLTENQLEIVCLKCKREGRGSICTTG